MNGAITRGRTKAAYLMTTAALVAAGLATPAHAQDAARPAASPAGPGFALEEVVVTARRRVERLQDVPVAVTALSAQDIQRANISRTDELQRVAPGFSVTPAPFGNGPLAPTIRSQRQPLSNLVYDQSVNTYFAEVVQARPIGLNTAFFDIGSIQVLKGPQGTLFGRNATGGALLITPAPPTGDFGGYARATVGNYKTHNIEGAVNLPVTEALQLRLAGRIGRRDGYVESQSTGNELDNERTEAIRLSVRLAPPDSRFSTTAVLDYLHEHDSGAVFRPLVINPAGATALVFPGIIADTAQVNAEGFHASSAATPQNGTRIFSWGASLISEFELTDDLKLKHIFGYRKIKGLLQFDLDGTRFRVVDGTDALRARQYTHEVQLLGTALDGNLDFIVGAYTFRETGSDPQVTIAFNVPQFNFLYARNKSRSVFGQATYRIPAIQGLSVTLGGRQTWDKRYMNDSATRLGVCSILTADAGGVPRNPCFGEGSVKFDKVTYTASVEYKPTEDVLVYAAHRKGYRTGGFAAAPRRPSEFIPYRPEVVSDIELGLKATYRFGGMVGRTNLAVYTAKYTDIQRSFSFIVNQIPRSAIINAADARVKGVELEQMWRPLPHLELSVGYALSDAKYKTFITPDGRDYSDSPFSGAPKHAVNGQIRWDVPMGDELGELAFQVSGAYRSKTVAYDVISYNVATRTVLPQLVIPSYHTFDARIDWTKVMGHENLSAALWVKNLTNEDYVTTLTLDYAAVGISSGLLGPPRTYGLELNVAF
jgi:iron complex outermembrane receptor protein